jgi:predicted PurR-regulated permease PerM
MDHSTRRDQKEFIIENAVDITLKIGALLLLLAWCFQIIRPFINILLWAMIIAITLYPMYLVLLRKIKSKKFSSSLLVLILLAIFIVPTLYLSGSLVDGIRDFSNDLDQKSLVIPPPPEEVTEWPLIGGTLFATWDLASANLQGFLEKYYEELTRVGNWLLGVVMDTGIGIFQLIISIIIAGILLVSSDAGESTSGRIFKKMAGRQGEQFTHIAAVTIRNVAKGILGVAFIQSFLLAVVFLAADIPYAGLWGLLVLILCIVQIGPVLVTIPVIIYLFTAYETWVAVLWTVVIILVSLSDNILKPMMMGKGAPVPTLVIFLGAIGGMMVSGFLGLFIGAIVLSLGYKLYQFWIQDGQMPPTEEKTDI